MHPLDLGQLEPGVVLGVGGEFRCGGGFEPQVQFTQNHAFEMGDDIHRPQAAGRRRQQFRHARSEIEGVDILAEGLFDPGAQHLDSDHFAGVAQPRLVHLRNRGGGDRFAELAEEIVGRHVQLAFHGFLGKIDGEGRQLVLQHTQLRGHLLADDIWAGREDLSELDIGRAQRRQRPRRRGHVRIAFVAQPFERPAQHPRRDAQRRRCVESVEHRGHGAGALQRRPGADQPPDVVRSAHVRASSRNAGRQSPCSGCGTWHCRSRRRAPCPGTSPGPGTCGSIPPGTDSCRGRWRSSAPWSE